MFKSLLPWKHTKTKVMVPEQTMEDEQVIQETRLIPCQTCGRTFLPQPLKKHGPICEKNAIKKRKVFDSLKQRVEGTDLAQFHQKTYLKRQESTPKPIEKPKKANHWEENHQKLVDAIRSAKGATREMSPNKKQAITTSSSNERCPHCERQFGPKAFDRHVEWCKEHRTRIQKSPATVLLAKERLEARTKYKVPPLNKSKRATVKEKYSNSNIFQRTESVCSIKSTSSNALQRTLSVRKPKSVLEIVKKPVASPKVEEKAVSMLSLNENKKNVEQNKSLRSKRYCPIRTKINSVHNENLECITVAPAKLSHYPSKKLVTWKDMNGKKIPEEDSVIVVYENSNAFKLQEMASNQSFIEELKEILTSPDVVEDEKPGVISCETLASDDNVIMSPKSNSFPKIEVQKRKNIIKVLPSSKSEPFSLEKKSCSNDYNSDISVVIQNSCLNLDEDLEKLSIQDVEPKVFSSIELDENFQIPERDLESTDFLGNNENDSEELISEISKDKQILALQQISQKENKVSHFPTIFKEIKIDTVTDDEILLALEEDSTEIFDNSKTDICETNDLSKSEYTPEDDNVRDTSSAPSVIDPESSLLDDDISELDDEIFTKNSDEDVGNENLSPNNHRLEPEVISRDSGDVDTEKGFEYNNNKMQRENPSASSLLSYLKSISDASTSSLKSSDNEADFESSPELDKKLPETCSQESNEIFIFNKSIDFDNLQTNEYEVPKKRRKLNSTFIIEEPTFSEDKLPINSPKKMNLLPKIQTETIKATKQEKPKSPTKLPSLEIKSDKIELLKARRQSGDKKLTPIRKDTDNVFLSYESLASTPYDPFISAERQFLELLECDTSTSTKPLTQPIRPYTAAETPKPAVKKITKSAEITKKRASVIDPPTCFQDSDAADDDFEILENLINDQFNSETRDFLTSLNKQNKDDFNVILNQRKYSDTSSVDSSLINETDNLSIPEHFKRGNYSPESSEDTDITLQNDNVDLYSLRYDKKIEPKENIKKKSKTKIKSNSSFGSGDSTQIQKKTKNNVFASSPSSKDITPKGKTKNSPTKIVESDELDFTIKPDELFSVDDKMYAEYKIYEEMYLKEKEQKTNSKRQKAKKEVKSYGIEIMNDEYSTQTNKSNDSAYGSLNRNSPKLKTAKLSPLQRQRMDSASSSGSDNLTTTIPNQRMSKFCHECGNKYPVTTAKFCPECGVKRLLL